MPRTRLETHGYLVLPGAFEPGLLEAARRCLEARLADGGGRRLEVGDRRFMLPIEVAPPFDDPRLYASPAVLPLVCELLGPDCIVNSYVSVVALPGAEAQAVHRDHDFLFGFDRGVGLPHYALTLAIPLVDLDARTGTTAIYAGSHRRSERYQDLGPPTLPYAKLGDGYLMDYRVSHGGTPNPGAAARPILYIVYSRPWFIDERNFYSLRAVTLGEDTLARVPPALAHLLALAGAGRAEVVP